MHTIHFVNDEAMPEGHDFIFIQTALGALIFYRESALSPEVLEDSWAAYRALDVPSQDVGSRSVGL